TDASWDGAQLHHVVRASLKTHLGGGHERVLFEGDDFRVRPKSARSPSRSPSTSSARTPPSTERYRWTAARSRCAGRPGTSASGCPGRKAAGRPSYRPGTGASALA